MNSKKTYSRKEVLDKALRYVGVTALAGLTGFLATKSLLAGKSCRDYSRCDSCKDTSNCSLVTKKEIGSKWKVKERGSGRK